MISNLRQTHQDCSLVCISRMQHLKRKSPKQQLHKHTQLKTNDYHHHLHYQH